MRKYGFLNTVFTLLLMCITLTIHAQNDSVTQEEVKTEILVKKYNWEPVILAIAKIESHENPKAVSKSGRYVGYLQISKVLVDECNKILGKKHYTYSDRYSVEKSKEMFVLIQGKYNKTCSVEKAIRIWNGGPMGHRKNSTLGYYRRVMNKMGLTAKQ